MSATGTSGLRRQGKRDPKTAARESRAFPRAPSAVISAVRIALFGPFLGLAAAPASATDFYWDTNGATAGAGGTTPGGTWSTTDATLSADPAGGVSVSALTTTTADRLFFSAGADATGTYTVAANGTQNIGRLTFNDGVVNLTGGTINFGNAAAVIDGDATMDSISAVLAGTGGLRFNGGTVRLNGTAANTYTGTTQVGGAGLAQATVFLAATGGNAISGGFLQIGGNNGTSAGFVTLNAAEQISDTATVQLNSGHYSGSSIFSLNGFNETLGGINLHHQGNGSSATFRNGGATDAAVTLAGSGTYTTGSGDRLTGRSIQNGGAGKLNVVVSLTGSGMQTFAGIDPTYTGTTTVNSGTLRLWNASLWASNATLNGGVLDLQQTSAGTGYLAGAATRTHANTIGGTGGTLRKTGDGTVILNAINTYQGATEINAGTLQAGTTSAFGNGSAVTLANVAGATLNLNGFSNSIGSLAGGGALGGNVNLGAATLTTGSNNTSTSYGGVISGTGALTKTGSGTLTLTGSSTYSGATTVTAGTLRVNGSLGASAVTVNAGGTLGGAGTLGGPVTLGAGATLDAGPSAGTAGLLTMGSLSLDAGSQLNYDLGAPNVVGGTSNDLVQVNGNLALGGTVNVNAPGGTFANTLLPGSYRLINYTGTLSGSVAIGSIPADFATSQIQTVVPGQVNLIAVQNGVPTQFWDGIDTLGNGAVNGGTDAWNNASSNWTNAAGSINQSWLPGVGIFTGTAGVATLAEPLTAMGLQFVTDGYQVTSAGGAPLSMVAQPDGGVPFIRVDPGATATVDSVIAGTAGLLKADGGTLILSGANTYAGGTTISGGTLQLGNGGTSGAIVGDVVNDGVLAFNRSDTFVMSGLVSGTGSLRQIGSGTTVLTRDNGYTGGTAITAGTLQVGDGGTSGSIVGDVTNDGVLVFNRSDALTFGGSIGGSGTLTKTGSGALTLTGSSTYSGATTVAGGTLRVNGSLGASAVGVNTGSTLGGAGTLGAAVTLAAGTTLDPGSVADSVGLLTTGSLSFDATSQLAYDLGAPNVVGGASNDRVQVNGNLALGGTVNVNAPGTTLPNTLLPGSYRLIDYTGTLSGSLAVGSVPGDFAASQIQTVVPGQVNLIAVQNGVPMQFWDGADTSGDGALNGGTNAWNNASSNWTNANGSINQSWVPGVGIFTGTAGVAAMAGPLTAMGLQFITDGYQLTSPGGAQLTMAVRPDGGTPFIRVDPGATATIDAVIAGTAGLLKADGGTLILSGTNTYTGGTTISGGTLQLGDGGTSGSILGDVASDGVLAFNRSDTFVMSGLISGTGSVRQIGSGTTVLTRDNSYTGGTTITAGTLQVGDGGTSGSILGNVNNDAVLAFNRSDAITFNGAISGTGMISQLGTGTTVLTAAANTAGSVTIDAGTLRVDGTLATSTIALADAATLVVNGTVQAPGATPAAISGTGGVNSVTVNAGATLLATGDLGDGADVLDVAGRLDAGAGTFALGAGDDVFVIHDNTEVIGALDAGPGNDLLNADVGAGHVAALDAATGFESLAKSGPGTLQVNGSSDFIDVLIHGGVLDVTPGATVAARVAALDGGATLNVAGDFLFTPGADTFTVAGTVTGLGSIDMLDGDDDLTLLDGADLSGFAALEGGAGSDTLTANIAATATLGGTTGFETLIKDGAGLLTIAGSAPSVFDTVLVRGGSLAVAASAIVDPQTTVVDAGAAMTVDGVYHGRAGADTFTLSGTLAGTGTIDLLDGDDMLTINTGAAVTFNGLFDASTANADRFVLAGTGSGTFDASLIDTVFRNFDSFRKEGPGTWRLTGTGAQSWTVSEGTLIGNSASLAGNIANEATVIFDQATDGAYNGVLSGAGTLIKQNTGTLVVTGTHTFTGSTRVESGTLQVDGMLPGTMRVESGATLSGVGTVGSLTALTGGFVQPGKPSAPFGTLTIAGDYSGGASVRINAELGDASSAASRLIIQGNATGSTSPVLVDGIGGNGAQTSGEGIGIIEVDGSSAPDSFRLAQPVQAGAYEYLLYQGGSSDTNDWFLRSELTDPRSPPNPAPVTPPRPAFRPAVAGYVLGHQASLEQGFMALGTLRDRVGNQGRMLEGDAERPNYSWLRAFGSELDVAGERFEAKDFRTYGLHFGTDVYQREAGEAREHVGVMVSVGESSTRFIDSARDIAGLSTRAGKANADVTGAGFYWTRYGGGGNYLDLTAQGLHHVNRYHDQFGAASRQSGWSATASAEIGSAFKLGGTGWQIEPQFQFAYERLELDAFSDDVSVVSAVKDDALRARGTVRVMRAPADGFGLIQASPYLALGVQHDFRDAALITIGDTALRDRVANTAGEVSAGFDGSLKPGLELHVDVRYQRATDGEKDGLRANIGFRMNF